jgi:hypothetical protein
MKKLIFLSCMSLAACATDPDKIQATYVSPLQYEGYTCKQLAAEMAGVSRRASELYGTLDKEAGNDAAQMGVGLVLFWPALFFLEGGDGPQAAEYARLKGERDALESAAIKRGCDMGKMPRFETPKPQAQQQPKGTNG